MKSSIQKSPFVDNTVPKQDMHMEEHKDFHSDSADKDVHQSTMLHLKDKLLRKFDSMVVALDLSEVDLIGFLQANLKVVHF
jgi:hypothetical protein